MDFPLVFVPTTLRLSTPARLGKIKHDGNAKVDSTKFLQGGGSVCVGQEEAEFYGDGGHEHECRRVSIGPRTTDQTNNSPMKCCV